MLSNTDKRKIYDKYGEAGLKEQGESGGDHDPFSSFFGDFGFFGSNQRRERDAARGGDVVMDLFVTLEELYSGNFVEVGY